MTATSGDLRAARALAFVGAMLLAHTAWAAPPSENVATARELYKQGADALDAHDAKTAVTKLKSAWALVQTPVIGHDLARAHLALGQLVDAREAALAVMRIPVAFDETERSRQARTESSKLADSLAARIPHVTIRVQGTATEQATVKLDGNVVPAGALTVARQANPGAHQATIDTEDGRHAEASVTVGEGDSKELVLALPEPKAAPPPVTPPPVITAPHDGPAPLTSAQPRERVSYVSPVVWVGVATAGVGLAVGLITGALALGSASTVAAHCTVVKNGVNLCPTQYAGELSTGNTEATISTIGFVTAGVGVGVLVTGLLLSGKRDAPPSASRPRLVPIFGSTTGLTLVIPASL
jgi:hypothetical protein